MEPELTKDSSWKELVDALEPCWDCSLRGRMWVTNCRDRCCAFDRWDKIRKIVAEKTAG